MRYCTISYIYINYMSRLIGAFAQRTWQGMCKNCCDIKIKLAAPPFPEAYHQRTYEKYNQYPYTTYTCTVVTIFTFVMSAQTRSAINYVQGQFNCPFNFPFSCYTCAKYGTIARTLRWKHLKSNRVHLSPPHFYRGLLFTRNFFFISFNF